LKLILKNTRDIYTFYIINNFHPVISLCIRLNDNGLTQFNKNFQILFKFLKYINVNEEIK